MKLSALLFIIAAVSAATITLPVTQDFSVVNPGRTKASIALPDILSLFNNGISSSIPYFGVDLNPIITAASITSTSTISTVILSAHLVVRNYSITGTFLSDSITVPFSSMNPGQVWSENTVTLSSTPTVKGQMGTITFTDDGATTMDVKNYIIEALSMPYQGGMFGFQVGQPGGPIEIQSHRSDPNAVVVEIEYNRWVAPPTTKPSSTSAQETTIPPVTTTTTSAPARNCWSCGPGYSHWYDLGLPQPEDPCACIRTSTPETPSTTNTDVPVPVPPTSAQPSGQATTTTIPQGSSPTSPERNGSETIYFTTSMFVVTAVILLL